VFIAFLLVQEALCAFAAFFGYQKLVFLLDNVTQLEITGFPSDNLDAKDAQNDPT